MTSRKRIYSPSFTEAKQFWVTYRWEFMRRDPEYIKAYNEILELQSQVQSNQDADDIKMSSALEEKMSLFPKKFDMFLPNLWDPNKTFDEITNKGKESAAFAEAVLYTSIGQSPISIISRIGGKNVPKDHLWLQIDFNKINSIDALKKAVIDHIDFYWKNDYLKRLPERIKVNKVKFDKIIEVGDLKKSNHRITWKDIAAKAFSEETDSESAIMKAKQHYSRYEELINGGWRNLRFP
jgi:hypothetical protein